MNFITQHIHLSVLSFSRLFESGIIKFIAVASVGMLSSSANAATPFTTEGKFSVGNDGAANYNIPLVVVPGTAGMQPHLSLSYSSNGGNGVVGLGWGVDGLSQITRCSTTLDQDGGVKGITYTGSDRFCIEGQRLIATTDTYNSTTKQYSTTSAYGANGTEYRTETANFSKIISYGSAGNGPAYFKVWTKSGQILEYGNTADSAIEAQGKTTIRAWGVNKISDTKGNYITVTYTEDNANGQTYVQRIDYTGNTVSTPVLTPYASVQFVYEARPDSTISYQAGSVLKTTQRLTNIQAYSATTLVKNYKIAYELSPSTNRSRLKTLTECDGNVTAPACKFPITIAYQDNQGISVFGASYQWQSANAAGTGFASQDVDMNGDGKADIYMFNSSNGTHIVWLNNGSGSFPSSYTWQSAAGRGTGYVSQLADFNGDGAPDIYMFNSSNGTHIVWLNNGSGSFPTSYTWQSAGGFGTGYAPQLADLNGDGLSDIYMFNSSNGTHIVWLNNGSGSFPTSYTWQSAGGFGTGYTSQLADFNGDGLVDIYLYKSSNGTHAVWINQGNGSFASTYQWQTASSGFGTGYTSSPLDMNGDGNADIYMFNSANGSHVIWINNGNGSFPTSYFWQSANGYGTGYTAQLTDFNGDGKPDIYLFKSASGSHMNWSQQGLVTDVLKQIDSVAGNSSRVNVSYKTITDSSVYTKDTSTNAWTYPYIDVQAPINVVSSTTTSDGLGGAITVNYQYGGLKAHLRGRGLVGFRYVKEFSPDSGLGVTTFYHQYFPLIGLPFQIEKRRLSDNGLLSMVQNSYAVGDLAIGAVITKFPYLIMSIEQAYELNGALVSTTQTTNQYDDYGNVKSVIVDDGVGNVKTTTNIYKNDVSNWLLGRLVRSTINSTKAQ